MCSEYTHYTIASNYFVSPRKLGNNITPIQRIKMPAKSSIHLEHNSEVKVGYFFHNSREKPTANSIFPTDSNYCNVSGQLATENFFDELSKREQLYTARTGKKLHKKTIKHISAIVNLNEHHTKEDLEKVISYLEETFDTKVIQYSIHRDEGFIDESSGANNVNYHAHLEMLGLDSQGNSIRRKFGRKELISLQNKVAELLKMERGINYTKEKKKRPKRLDTYEFKEYKKRESNNLKQELQDIKLENKALENYLNGLTEEINRLEDENFQLKMSKKDLEKEISKLRKEMIEHNKNLTNKEFTQQDYKALSELKKELNAKNVSEIYENLKVFEKNIKERINKQQTTLIKQNSETKGIVSKKSVIKTETALNIVNRTTKPDENETFKYFYASYNILKRGAENFATTSNENSLLERENKRLREENENLKEENKTLNKLLKQFKEKFENAEKKIKSLTKQLNKAKEFIKGLGLNKEINFWDRSI